MSVSSGSIVGASGVPTTKIILNASSGGSTYNITACLNTEVLGSPELPASLSYQLLIPQKVGCNIDLGGALGQPSNTSVLGLSTDGTWGLITTATVTFSPGGTLNTLGCFYEGILDVDNITDNYCDLVVCLDGDFTLPPCKVIQGCENFCVYISKKNGD